MQKCEYLTISKKVLLAKPYHHFDDDKNLAAWGKPMPSNHNTKPALTEY